MGCAQEGDVTRGTAAAHRDRQSAEGKGDSASSDTRLDRSACNLEVNGRESIKEIAGSQYFRSRADGGLATWFTSHCLPH
jgi:hypothetical protein